ncbi:hypothetical protein PYW08_010184 [Mythimna loreyi]|uniref:Uncharacterized protein n=1 Tax=Mythimna loreyi TaxID=667449 RepID=A0ACC2Q6G5_9NEOP|nr:hypothetical protein PYW08_010184 [Mythimna loreyi]
MNVLEVATMKFSPFTKQMFVATAAQLASVSMGGSLGYPCVLLQQFQSSNTTIHTDLDTLTWIASMHGLAGIGATLMPIIMQVTGRKYTFIGSSLLLLIGWVLAYAAKDILTDGEISTMTFSPFVKQMFVVTAPQLAAVSMGGTIGYPCVLLQQFQSSDTTIHTNLDTLTWIASMHGVAGIAATLMPTIMQLIGRKYTFMGSSLLLLIGWVLAFTAKDIMAASQYKWDPSADRRNNLKASA